MPLSRHRRLHHLSFQVAQVGKPDPRWSWRDHALPVTDLTISHGGVQSKIVTVSKDQTCKVFCLVSGQLILSVSFPVSLCSLALDSTCDTIYTGGDNGQIYIFSLRSPPRSVSVSSEAINATNLQAWVYKGYQVSWGRILSFEEGKGRSWRCSVGKNITLKKGKWKQSIIFRLLKIISNGEKGKGTEVFGKKIKIKKDGRRISSCRELYTSLTYRPTKAQLPCWVWVWTASTWPRGARTPRSESGMSVADSVCGHLTSRALLPVLGMPLECPFLLMILLQMQLNDQLHDN